MLTLTDTKISILTCTRCELADSCRSPIPTDYNNPAHPPRYIVVGEAPGQVEDQKGLPFVGPSGLFLKRTLRKAGLRPSDGAFLNAVSCYPKQQKTPTISQIAECRINLFHQLQVLESPFVLVVGAIPLSSLLPKVTLTWAMGGPIDAHSKRLFPIYHPSYILRTHTKEVFNMWERHIQSFAQMVDGQYTTRDTLQIANCLYCAAGRMSGKVTCIRHEGQFVKDCQPPKFREGQLKQLDLFQHYQ